MKNQNSLKQIFLFLQNSNRNYHWDKTVLESTLFNNNRHENIFKILWFFAKLFKTNIWNILFFNFFFNISNIFPWTWKFNSRFFIHFYKSNKLKKFWILNIKAWNDKYKVSYNSSYYDLKKYQKFIGLFFFLVLNKYRLKHK